MPTIERVGPAFAFSLFRYLTTVEYTVGVTTGKFTDHHTGLKIRSGYPDDLLTVTVPTLAVVAPMDFSQSALFYGMDLREDRLPFAIYGFVAGQGATAELKDAANRVYRDRLYNDVYMLLSGPASDAGFELYDHVTKTVIGAVELDGVTGRLIPVNAPEVEADRYKFLVEGVAYLS